MHACMIIEPAMILVLVKSRYEYNIVVISQVRGAAEDAEITAILYEHVWDLTGFYPVH